MYLRKSLRKSLNNIVKKYRNLITGAPVLIYGETGTGKEVFAEFLHRALRRRGRFVYFSSFSVPETLFESELFGHKRGAFTGAFEDKKGLVEEADGGTLFIDEIGEVPLSIQTKLLRLVDRRRFRKVGEVREREVDLLLICATNKSLERLVKANKFREDFYHRLKGIRIYLPPLRDEPEEILPLVKDFIKEIFRRENIKFSSEVIELLLCYQWPGNVRELKRFVETLPDRDHIGINDIDFDFFQGHCLYERLKRMRERKIKDRIECFIKAMILFYLKENGWNIKGLCEELGKGKSQVYEMLKRMGVVRKRGKEKISEKSEE